MAATNPDKAAQVARIEAIEAGTSDADTLLAAWRDAKTVQLNLRTRLRRAIAASPSLPPALAAEVVQTFPRELYDNPALPLLLLEAPTLLGLAPQMAAAAAVRVVVPRRLVEALGARSPLSGAGRCR